MAPRDRWARQSGARDGSRKTLEQRPGLARRRRHTTGTRHRWLLLRKPASLSGEVGPSADPALAKLIQAQPPEPKRPAPWSTNPARRRKPTETRRLGSFRTKTPLCLAQSRQGAKDSLAAWRLCARLLTGKACHPTPYALAPAT